MVKSEGKYDRATFVCDECGYRYAWLGYFTGNRRTVSRSGTASRCDRRDEGYYSCGPELRTAARYNIPIKVLVINNGGQCIVRQWTTHMFGGNDVGVIDHVDGVKDMDFIANAESYGISGKEFHKKKKCYQRWRECWRPMALILWNAWFLTKIVIRG